MSVYLLLSAVDMLAGFLILIRHKLGFWLFLFGILMLVKGAYSFFSAVSAGYWLDWMGAVDMLAGFSLMLLYLGFAPHAYLAIGAMVIVKGVYSLLRSALAAR